MAEIPARKAIIDAGLVACDAEARQPFRTLTAHSNDATLALWAFDLLALDGIRLMPLPLGQRKELLAKLVAAADTEYFQF